MFARSDCGCVTLSIQLSCTVWFYHSYAHTFHRTDINGQHIHNSFKRICYRVGIIVTILSSIICVSLLQFSCNCEDHPALTITQLNLPVNCKNNYNADWGSPVVQQMGIEVLRCRSHSILPRLLGPFYTSAENAAFLFITLETFKIQISEQNAVCS